MKAYPIKATQFLSSIRSCSISALIVFLPACIIKCSFFFESSNISGDLSFLKIPIFYIFIPTN